MKRIPQISDLPCPTCKQSGHDMARQFEGLVLQRVFDAQLSSLQGPDLRAKDAAFMHEM